MKANKGQIIIYNRIVGQIQGYLPPQCYVLGRSWKSRSNGVPYSCLECFDKLGKIDVFGIEIKI